MPDTSALVRAFDIQAGACAAFGSPFSGALTAAAARDIEAGGPTAALVRPWAEADTRSIIGDAVPIRWLGAVHDLVLSGEDSGLAAAFPAPDRPPEPAAAWGAAQAAMTARPERFAAFMAHEPQTNEVRRSIALLGGFLTVAAETGLPLRLFEVGASAGLNQLWDRYHHDLGAAGVWGPADAAVRLDTAWTGPAPPLEARVRVVSRAACDRKPVDIRDPLQRRRLKAYIWADQAERLARLDGAIAGALAAGVQVQTADAVAWTAAQAAPAQGAATVLFHSVFWQYMPPASQAALTAAIAAHGATASPEAPFAWLRMEPPPENLAVMELRLTLWPGGQERLLGHAHPHGATVDWGV